MTDDAIDKRYQELKQKIVALYQKLDNHPRAANPKVKAHFERQVEETIQAFEIELDGFEFNESDWDETNS